MNDERSTDDTQQADAHTRLRKEYRELIKAYADARVTGRVPLSYWPAVDKAAFALGTRLGYTHEEIKYMLISTVVSVPLGDLLTSIDRLGDELTAHEYALSDPERRSRLRTLFRELVALYAISICAGRLDMTVEPHIDRKFTSIARVVEEDFDALKAAELASCAARSPVAPDQETAAAAPEQDADTAAPDEDPDEDPNEDSDEDSMDPEPERPMKADIPVASDPETVVAVDPAAGVIAGRPPIERPLPATEFGRLAMPHVMASVATDAESRWISAKTAIEELERKPEDYAGTAKEYLETVRERLETLRGERDDAYRIFTATRNRAQPDPDADVKVVVAVQEAIDRLRVEHGGILPPAAVAKAREVFEQQMQESRFYEHYPTPRHIIERMLDVVDLRTGERVLEPSAGEGNIAEAIRDRTPGAVLEVVEFQPLLADILTLKGFTVVGSDFLAYNTTRGVKYDVIVMNPPFDKGVDIEHVYHAYGMLRDGGRLVAVTSGSAIDGSDEENYAFRDFLEKRGSWKMYTPKEYMGAAGKLSNGRQIGIVTAVVNVTRPANDTFGSTVVASEQEDASEGQYVFDTQGAQAYELLAIEDGSTKARNLTTGSIRTFHGHLRTGGRFLAAATAEEALALATAAGDDVPRDADGRIRLPDLPPAPPEGEAGLKPLRIVTSRHELMPAASTVNLFSERIASNVQLTGGQIDGINRAMAAMDADTGSFLLADGTGFGKTLQQLVIAATIVERERRPVLIFTKSPSIIETSFADDARKLHIDTPDAQNIKDRKVFKGATAAGMALKRVSKIEEIATKPLSNDIYIASYHIFGRWDGDKREREELKVWKATRVDPLKVDFAKRRTQIRQEARWLSQDRLQHLLDGLQAEEDNHPVMVRARELREIIEAKNAAMFGSAGKRFAAVISDEAHAYKNYNPDDFNDGSYQAFRGMVLLGNADRRLLATATPADKVEHVRYLKGLNVYKTEEQYKRLMARLGFIWHEPEYRSGRIVRSGRFAFDAALPPEFVLNNISRLFENLTMAGTMIKRELSLDNFEARNVMIGGATASAAERAAVQQALNKLAVIDKELREKKRCKASIINEKKWALEPYKIQKTIEIARRELLEGRQVVIFASLVNDSGPSFTASPGECSAVDKPSTVNTLARELGALFGEDQIGYVTGVRSSTQETLSDADRAGVLGCALCDEADTTWTAVDDRHERSFFGSADHGLGDTLADATQRKRADDIRAFQAGHKRILIATPEAGGTGISLDDTVGNAPRSIIIMTSPFSSVEVVQILGRINRAKTRSRQRAFFLWVDVPVDRRLRDIIASKLRILGAAVQGEVKKVSVEEAEFASAENAQENYDKHNVDREGKLRSHSLSDLQVIDGAQLPSRIPFTLTHKVTISNEIEPESQIRHRWRPIRMKSNLRVGARQALKDWMAAHDTIVRTYGLELKTDRYEGPYIETPFNAELWQILLNFLKPENTRFVVDQSQRFAVGERVKAATDVIEANATIGMEGTVARVWQRRVRALDRESGKVMTDADGQIIWHMVYDYMVEFDNGQRANNLEAWELMPAIRLDDASEDDERTGLGGIAPRVTTMPAQTANVAPVALGDRLPAVVAPSLQDRITSLQSDVRRRVRERGAGHQAIKGGRRT